MTQDKFLGIVRHLMTGAGMYLLATNKLDETGVEQISGYVLFFAPFIWSWISKKK